MSIQGANLSAYSALMRSTSQSAKYMEQLSTGKRINSAADDAAGAIIVENMTTQIQGLQEASKSSTQAVSMLQTTEAGLKEMTNILQRMRKLSLQASSSTMSDANRKAVQKEIDALTKELGNISKSTQYNGVNLLDGKKSQFHIQTGIYAGDQMKIGMKSMTTASLGLNGAAGGAGQGVFITGRITGDLGAEAGAKYKINGADWRSTAASSVTTDNAEAAAKAINSNTSGHGVKATAFNEVVGKAAQKGVVWSSIKINGVDIKSANSIEEFVKNVNSQVAATGAKAHINEKGGITFTNETGKDIKIEKTGGTAGGSTADDAHLAQYGLKSGVYKGFLKLENADGSTDKTPVITLGSATNMSLFGHNRTRNEGKEIIGYQDVDDNAVAASDNIRINGVLIAGSATKSSGKADMINAVSKQTGVKARVEASKDHTVTAIGTALTINGVAITGLTAKSSSVTSADIDKLVKEINEKGGGTNFKAENVGGKLRITAFGGPLVISAATGFTGIATHATNAQAKGKIVLSKVDGSRMDDVSITGNKAALNAKLGLTAFERPTSGGNSAGVNVKNIASAAASIKNIDKALEKLGEFRADVGASQNRLESKLKSLMASENALKVSRGRIEDVDIAKATSSLTKQKVIQQAAQAMLQQTQLMEKSLLQLLK